MLLTLWPLLEPTAPPPAETGRGTLLLALYPLFQGGAATTGALNVTEAADQLTAAGLVPEDQAAAPPTASGGGSAARRRPRRLWVDPAAFAPAAPAQVPAVGVLHSTEAADTAAGQALILVLGVMQASEAADQPRAAVQLSWRHRQVQDEDALFWALEAA